MGYFLFIPSDCSWVNIKCIKKFWVENSNVQEESCWHVCFEMDGDKCKYLYFSFGDKDIAHKNMDNIFKNKYM